jgi:hypothetical protein
MCHRPVPFAPGTQPKGTQQTHVSAEPDFIPVIPPRRWGWTPWLVVLLGGTIIGSVVAYLVYENDVWLLALSAPAFGLLVILAIVWIIRGNETASPEDAETPRAEE